MAKNITSKSKSQPPAEVAQKCYHIENSNRIVESCGIKFQFTHYYHLSGCWLGIFSTKIPAEQAALKKLVDDKRSGVTEITAAEFGKCVERMKRNRGLEYISVQPVIATSGVLGMAVNDLPAEPVTGEMPSEPVEPELEPLQNVNAALSIGEAQNPEVPTEPSA